MNEDKEQKKIVDIFDGMDRAAGDAPTRPSVSLNYPVPPVNPVAPFPAPARSGLFMKAMLIAGIVLVIVIVGLVLYKFVFNDAAAPADETPSVIETEDAFPPAKDKTAEVPAPAPEAIAVETDSDSDGLSDAVEKALGTNILKIDSDGDALFDYDEVKIYGTDPLKADTDGDGYKDGAEVANGYNPKGPGKLLNFEKAINEVK